MRVAVVAFCLAMCGSSAWAQTDKEISCSHQADVVAAIKQARLDRVKERELPAKLAETATWPEKYNNIIPILAPQIYEIKRKDLKTQDLAGWWRDQCNAQ